MLNTVSWHIFLAIGHSCCYSEKQNQALLNVSSHCIWSPSDYEADQSFLISHFWLLSVKPPSWACIDNCTTLHLLGKDMQPVEPYLHIKTWVALLIVCLFPVRDHCGSNQTRESSVPCCGYQHMCLFVMETLIWGCCYLYRPYAQYSPILQGRNFDKPNVAVWM